MAIILGGGGGFRWPWDPKYVEPAIIPVAAPLAVVSKTIIKGAIPSFLAFGGGILAGTLLGGGSQEVTPTQTTAVVPELTAEQKQQQLLAQRMRDIEAKLQAAAEAKAIVTPTITPVVSPVTTTTYDVQAGGQVEIGGVSTITTTPTTTHTTTITHAGVSQEVVGQLATALQQATQAPQQITITMPEQKTEVKQEQSSWIIAAALVAAALLFGGKK